MIRLRTPPTAATRERFQFDFFIDEDSWQGAFDRVEVWRSRWTAGGPYEALHGDTWAPAQLPPGSLATPPSPAQTGPSAVLVGKTLSFLVDELTPVTIAFTGSDPTTFATAAAQIRAQSGGLLTAFVLGSLLYVQTVEAGLKSILRCTGGDAAPLLGLGTQEPDSLAFGQDARLVLVQGQEDYGFVDPNGCAKYFYRARFFNSITRTVGQYSTPFQGPGLTGLSTASLCRGYVKLVDMAGAPAAGQEVLIYNQFNGSQLEGASVVGGNQTLITDARGHAEVLLARGSLITVSIGGTPLARDVTIPTDTTVESVNLLAAASGQNDVFTVQVPNIPYAVRQSL